MAHEYPRPGGGAPIQVLQPSTVLVSPGEFVALVGPSGCGKTTLLNMAAGLITPTAGSVMIGGSAPAAGAPGIGYLLARDSLLPWRRAVDNVALQLELRGVGKRERHARARQALAQVGLDEFAEAYPGQLSHGMRQRVAVARTLVMSPDTLLMDEPFSALDAQTRLVLQDQFTRLWERIRCTVILVTHDLSEAVALADRVIVMGSRPGYVKADLPVDLPRPRNVIDLQSNDDFHRTFDRVWSVFRSEVTHTDDAVADLDGSDSQAASRAGSG